MSYSDLIRQEGEYTYSANIQFDIENDTKLLRFIPNETTIKLLREYFTDMVRAKSYNHARILYGSYGTGKSHLLTVLSQLIGKSFVDGIAYKTFIERIQSLDASLANDIEAYVKDDSRKPLLVVPIVFDFEDFDRCIYFSLKKKLDAMNIHIQYKTFYDQAGALINQWKSNSDSELRLRDVCSEEKISLEGLEQKLEAFDPRAEKAFERIFSAMTFGVKYIYEVTNMSDTINQANAAIAQDYSGILFIFDEFGRYMEDNLKRIKVKSVQDLAEFCDHCEGNNHILLVSHKEISQYTQHYGKSVSAEWKKVEGRYKADSINSKQDQCLSLIKSVLVKVPSVWEVFEKQFTDQLNRIYSDAMDFKGFLVNATSDVNPFEGGFPLHPIALFALDRLSKRVAQNDRTFFTFLAGKDENSLYRFLQKHELDEFHFVGIDDIYNYFEPSIKSVQSDDSYTWYKNLQTALAKNHSDEFDDSPEVRILKVVATIGIINDAGALIANRRTILSTIDCPKDVLANALEGLCEKKILKYSGTYDRYDFFDASIYDVEAMIEEESFRIGEDSVIKALNDYFVDFVLYPYSYNRKYKISRVFVPVYATFEDLTKSSVINKLGVTYDGLLVMLVGNSDITPEMVVESSQALRQSVVWVNTDCVQLISTVKKYIAAKYLESQKAKYIEKDPAFEKELQYNINEIIAAISSMLDEWKHFRSDGFVVCDGMHKRSITSMEGVSDLASDVMLKTFPHTLLVNNELINKNVISGSITAAKKNAIRAIISGGNSKDYFGLQYLSPDYIAVRSVLAKNNFIVTSDDCQSNELEDGFRPQDVIRTFLSDTLARAKKGNVEFGEVYSKLKQPPYGLRDGYLSLLLAGVLAPYKKTLIISSHGSEQELTAELFEEIVKRPNDYMFTVADWTKEQLSYMDQLEAEFSPYIDPAVLAKNRLKAIYDGMLSHYKSVTKFSRTTQKYISDQTQKYRQLMERSYASFSTFFFAKLKGLTGDYDATLTVVKDSKVELESAQKQLMQDIKNTILRLINMPSATSLREALLEVYENEWKAKRQRSFDYYTNAFLEFVGGIGKNISDDEIITKLSKSLTGIESSYWSDKHVDEFESRLVEIKKKIDEYVVSDTLSGSETRMTLTTASGAKKEIVFDNGALSNLGVTVKNKIHTTLGNFGLSISYDDKVQILLSLLNDLMEGKK